MRKNGLFFWRWMLYTGAALALTGCDKLVIFNSKGSVGIAERDILVLAIVIMSLVIVPVIIMAVWFPYKYRASNPDAHYDPKFIHSTKLEALVWGIPIIIIAFLAFITYKSSHELDPYKPLVSPHQPVTIEVVALNWKWLFIYPDLGIATVNEIYFPKDVPVNFKITSDAPMNSFFIPQLGGQIYAMAGMETKLHLQANEAGTYRGLSANYSGIGFAGMSFTATATKDEADFNAWVQRVRASGQTLDDVRYSTLVQDSTFEPVAYFAEVKPHLFMQIMMKYAAKGNADMPMHTQAMAHEGMQQNQNDTTTHATPMALPHNNAQNKD